MLAFDQKLLAAGTDLYFRESASAQLAAGVLSMHLSSVSMQTHKASKAVHSVWGEHPCQHLTSTSRLQPMLCPYLSVSTEAPPARESLPQG